jgi:hypothetical protein
MNGMALKRAAKKKRRYISQHRGFAADKLFLVYMYDSHAQTLLSDGPFKKQEEANTLMREKLANGVCSWIVSYDG